LASEAESFDFVVGTPGISDWRDESPAQIGLIFIVIMMLTTNDPKKDRSLFV